ncbi:MAG: hypothetical protein PWQ82_101 [Thermosediminibacterales bacterium]|nr:hypothetical protein [Thermosediminibacterales bacterium]MDK2836389.1 hypothetical protein [Thermosediminibacterales bacterium]
MTKFKTCFICQECGHETTKWMGRCPNCGSWNTMVEEIYQKPTTDKKRSLKTNKTKPQPLLNIDLSDDRRLTTGIAELDTVLGGGIVEGSVILVGGDPGIGKSTLLLQVSDNIASLGNPVLYVSGEESAIQLKIRAQRLNVESNNLLVVTETDIETVLAYVTSIKPKLVVIDSIQTMVDTRLSSTPGSVSQVRECTGRIMAAVKYLGIPTILVGHVTKQGTIAGPRVVEHMVDCVLYFEGEKNFTYRVLRAVKNRFGSTNEIGVFEMSDSGLKEVKNPSEILLSGRPEGVPGSVVVPSIEGSRPVMLEIQALVSPTAFGMPRRMATGVDYNRVSMLMAVLEKRAGLYLSNQDAYVNAAGGIRINEPAADLGIAAALASSFKDVKIDPKMIAVGEIGLTGELRGVSFIEKRIKEAIRLGFNSCVLPKNNIKGISTAEGIKFYGVKTLVEALDILLGG